jgi:hypothetical protein
VDLTSQKGHSFTRQYLAEISDGKSLVELREQIQTALEDELPGKNIYVEIWCSDRISEAIDKIDGIKVSQEIEITIEDR